MYQVHKFGYNTFLSFLPVGRTTPNLNDVGLAFHDLGINLAELGDFVDHVEVPPAHADLPKFPAPRTNQLCFPSRNSREVKEREEHVYDHLPPMYPCKEGRCISSS